MNDTINKEGIYFITVNNDNGNVLTNDQYKRLKRQISRIWPKDIQRPILLEGGMTVTKL